MKKDKNKKFSAFWAFYIVLVIVLFIASFAAISYLKKCIDEYEAALPDKYMDYLTTTDEGIKEFDSFVLNASNDLVKNTKFEDSSLYADEISGLLSGGNLSYEANKAVFDANNPEYIVDLNGNKMVVGIQATNQVTKLKLLAISDWELSYVELPHEYDSYKVIAPSTYKVMVNGVELTDDEVLEKTNFDVLEAAAELIDVPCAVEYEIKDLGYKPEIKIVDAANNEVASSWIDDNTVKNDVDFISTDDVDLNSLPLDVVQIAKNWSMFYMNELSGAYGGMDKVRAYLVPDSFLDQRAYEYGSRGFYEAVTSHTLASIVNTKVSNYTKYNDDCFSVDINFLKNLIVENGRNTTDTFDNRMFFAYVKDHAEVADGWYLVDVRTVLE